MLKIIFNFLMNILKFLNIREIISYFANIIQFFKNLYYKHKIKKLKEKIYKLDKEIDKLKLQNKEKEININLNKDLNNIDKIKTQKEGDYEINI